MKIEGWEWRTLPEDKGRLGRWKGQHGLWLVRREGFSGVVADVSGAVGRRPGMMMRPLSAGGEIVPWDEWAEKTHPPIPEGYERVGRWQIVSLDDGAYEARGLTFLCDGRFVGAGDEYTHEGYVCEVVPVAPAFPDPLGPWEVAGPPMKGDRAVQCEAVEAWQASTGGLVFGEAMKALIPDCWYRPVRRVTLTAADFAIPDGWEADGEPMEPLLPEYPRRRGERQWLDHGDRHVSAYPAGDVWTLPVRRIAPPVTWADVPEGWYIEPSSQAGWLSLWTDIASGTRLGSCVGVMRNTAKCWEIRSNGGAVGEYSSQPAAIVALIKAAGGEG